VVVRDAHAPEHHVAARTVSMHVIASSHPHD
jgi:hypothetical protein